MEGHWLEHGLVGFRFLPTEEEIITYFLERKMRGLDFPVPAVEDVVDICMYEPWDLPQRSPMPKEGQEWYFFGTLVSKSRGINRLTKSGYWKKTGEDRIIRDKQGKAIGFKKNFVFYKGRVPNGIKTNWIIHEYHSHKAASFPKEYVLSRLRGSLDHSRGESSGKMTLRHLENTKQKPDESFKEDMDSWKSQLLKIHTRPLENDQIKIIIQGTKSFIYNKMRMKTSEIADFKQLKEMVMDIKEEEAENRKFYGQNWKANRTKAAPAKVNSIKNRRFSHFDRPLSKVFEKLKMQGLLKPLEPRPLPNPIPRYMDMNQFCYFHQQKGHHTNNCTRLKHEIQDLIDNRTIPDPEGNYPNTDQNLLRNHQAMPPPAYM